MPLNDSNPTSEPIAALSADPASPQRSVLGVGVQILGFALCLALLGWSVHKAIEQLGAAEGGWDRLRSAPWWLHATLIGLSGFSIAINGVIWWLALRPAMRLGLFHTMKVNAAAMALLPLPLKASGLFRLAIHVRADGVPFLVFVGWLATLIAVLGATTMPFVAASLLFRALSAGWVLTGFGGCVACVVVMTLAAKLLTRPRTWRRAVGLSYRVGGRRALRIARGRVGTQLRAAFVLAGDWRINTLHTVLRLIDIAGITARLMIAGLILDIALPLNDALIGGVAYFLIAAVAPTGAAGVREGGTGAVLGLLGIENLTFAVAVLVSGTEALVATLLGGWALLALRKSIAKIRKPR